MKKYKTFKGRSVMTKAQQQQWLKDNPQNTAFIHKWSTNGMGSSKLINKFDDVIAKSSGCGYDRYGAAVGRMIETLFHDQLLKLAVKEIRGRGQSAQRKGSDEYYGLFYSAATGRAYVDGGCGGRSMEKILNKIGFRTVYHTQIDRSRTGEQFYTLEAY